MLQSIVGPPMVGATDLKSPPDRTVDRDFKGSGSDSSFGKALEEKVVSKSPKEIKESPQSEVRQKNEKPQKADAKNTEEVSKPDGKISKKATVRQKAIQEFMDSFESEFEISPTRLVEAMAKLDDKQLAQSPEVSADAVIDQLGLSDEDADKARAMYVSLITQLGQMPQQPKPAPEMAVGTGMSQQQMQARITAAQNQQNVMGASVDRLNKSFWMRQEPKAVPTAMPSLDASLAQKMMMDDSSLAAIPEEMPTEVPEMEMPPAPPAQTQGPKLEELPPHLQGQMKDVMSPALLAALAAKQAAQAKEAEGQSSEDAPALADEFQQAMQAPKVEKAPMAVPGQIPNAHGKASQEFFQEQSQGQSMMQQNSQESAQKGMTSGKEAATTLVEKAADFKHSLTGLEGIHGAPIKGESLRMDAAMPMTAAAPTAPANPAENDAAVKAKAVSRVSIRLWLKGTT